MNIGVLLSGSGVYDGSEIQEAVLTLLAIEEIGAKAICISIDATQHHVMNHLTGETMDETRNMLIESARIARGSVIDIAAISPSDLDALVIPGGFGNAKNFTTWAFQGPDSTIDPKVKLLLVNMVNIGKPIAALCVSPVVLAKALEGSSIKATLTLGNTEDASPYSIKEFNEGLIKTGVEATACAVPQIHVDHVNKIVSAPCYMMEASILDVRKNIRSAIEAVRDLSGVL